MPQRGCRLIAYGLLGEKPISLGLMCLTQHLYFAITGLLTRDIKQLI